MHNGQGLTPGIKNSSDEWDISGHLNRIVNVDEKVLSYFALLYDESGTDPIEAKLPAIYSNELLAVIRKLANYPSRLGSLKNTYTTTVMWDETNAVKKDKTIKRETCFTDSLPKLILSGPHFYVGSPCYKTPRSICTEKSHYSVLDLTFISDDYIPRTNYIPACTADEYNKRIQNVAWASVGMSQKTTGYYRLIYRAMLSPPTERTLIGAIIPPEMGHINGAQTTAFKNHKNLLQAAFIGLSLIGDFYIKTTGRSNLHYIWENLPKLHLSNSSIVRVLILNCLTTHYSDLWRNCWNEDFQTDHWTKNEIRLDNGKFSNLSSTWHHSCALRTDYERRQALVEIDVLAAMMLGLTVDELCTIYRIQFPVLRQNENDTWYDQNGRIVFTCSKGLPGVGFSRPEWNEIKDMKSGTVSRTIIEDTMPGGPLERTITYVAPFDKCDREEDYRTVWAEFERRFRV